MSFACTHLFDGAEGVDCQDAFVQSDSPTTNQGSATTVRFSLTVGTGAIRQGMFRKNLFAAPAAGDEIEAGDIIDSAILKGTITARWVTTGAPTLVWKLVNEAIGSGLPWVHSDVTHNTKRIDGLAELWQTAGVDKYAAPSVADVPPDYVGPWVGADLFQLANEAIANHGGKLSLIGTPTGSAAEAFDFRIHSMEGIPDTESGETKPLFDIVFRKPPEANAGYDQTISAAGMATLAGTADNHAGQVITWTTSGDGTFDDAHSLAAVYTPGPEDALAGEVTLTLTVPGETGPGGNFPDAVDEMVLTIITGYEIYISKDRAYQEGDVAIALVPGMENSFQTAVAGLGLLPASVYFASVIAVTSSGRSEPVSARFVTDGAGTPELRPSLVGNLSVVAGAGGTAVVRWTYDEPSGIGRADTFSIVVESLTGGAPIAVADVAAGTSREYQISLSGPDGDFRVKVFSKRWGLYEPAVTGMDVRLDGTPPVGDVPAMTAF